MAVPLTSSGLAKFEAVFHGYGTSPLEGRRGLPTSDSAHSWLFVNAGWKLSNRFWSPRDSRGNQSKPGRAAGN